MVIYKSSYKEIKERGKTMGTRALIRVKQFNKTVNIYINILTAIQVAWGFI